MSGICGIIALDGRPVEPGEIEALLAPLRRRGPDGLHAWRHGPVGLGHALLATTPEALVEMLPFIHPETGCTVTADVRLDNREELLVKLGLSGEARVIGDGELILQAYLKWGEVCPKHLLGDFAFAIWDPRAQRLFCARDPMGMRQLIYTHRQGRIFVLATEPEAIATLREVDTAINSLRVADFIDGMEAADLTSTFYKDILRLPPAHTLTLDENGLRLRCYWRPEPRGELRLSSDEEYCHAFLDIFREAVRCRLRSAGPVGALMSGGLDSGAVVAIASQLLKAGGKPPLDTFSIAGPQSVPHPETAGVYALFGLDHVNAHIQDCHALEGIEGELLSKTVHSREPFDGHMILVRAAYLGASRTKVKVVLDGVAADVLFTPDYPIAHLIRRGKFAAAIAESAGERHFWANGIPPSGSLPAEALRAFLPRQLRAFRRRFLHAARARESKRFSYFSTALLGQVDLRERRMECFNHRELAVFPDDTARAHLITHPDLIVGRERYDRVASSFAIEPRDPFMDLRLVNFCLSVPQQQLQFGGWPKVLMRRAFQGQVPATVRWKRGRHHLGWPITTKLLAGVVTEDLWSEAIPEIAWRYMDIALLQREARDWAESIDGQLALFEAYYLRNWLADMRI